MIKEYFNELFFCIQAEDLTTIIYQHLFWYKIQPRAIQVLQDYEIQVIHSDLMFFYYIFVT